MDIGCHLPVYGPAATREALTLFARRAEALGYDSLWVSDHVMRACWREDRVSFKGEFFAFEDLGVRPRPANGTIPIWIGGHTERALKRVVTLGDGWHAAFPSAQKMRDGIADLKKACAKEGR